MNRVSRVEQLKEFLRISDKQQELLARADWDSIVSLLQRRQELLAEIQSLDELNAEEKTLVNRIVATNRKTGCLLSLELVDIKDKIKKVGTLKKLVKASRPSAPPPSQRLSCRG